MYQVFGKPIVFLFFISIAGAVFAQEDESNDEPEILSCVNNTALRNPEIINDNLIVFHASGNRNYVNALPSTCYGLKRHGRISYQKSSRICANDWFNTLERAGTAIRLGISCQFGVFQLISDEQLEELRNPDSKPVKRETQPVEPPPVENPQED